MAARKSDSPYAPPAGPPGKPPAAGPPGRPGAAGSGGPWRDVDPEPPDSSLLARHGALVLDPLKALRLGGEAPPRPTVYLAASLIVPIQSLTPGSPARRYLDQALADEQLALDQGQLARELRRMRALPHREIAVQFRIADDAPAVAPDAWRVLQRARGHARAEDNETALAGIGLNHLLFACSHIDGHPVTGMSHIDGHPVFDSAGIAEYVMAGSGGRAPVSWVGGPPARRSKVTGRRPVVAVLDTGCGSHPWLKDGVERTLTAHGIAAQCNDAQVPNPELGGDLIGPMDGALDSHSGHGTFIAGLIRQISPDTDILALRIMGSDGIVQEGDLLRALSVLNVLVAEARAGGPGTKGKGREVDIVSLSLGYYHEAPEDAASDLRLGQQIQELSQLGVCVVACAGNDGTSRPMFPAAFAPTHTGKRLDVHPDDLPVLSVGALNPNGSIALFSNGGDWVLSYEVGAALVSTFPVSFNGGAQPSVRVRTHLGRSRTTIDPDSYTGGFGTWSGTSFSTPVLAARLARQLEPALCDTKQPVSTVGDAITRMWGAITAATGWLP
jgi:serine protease